MINKWEQKIRISENEIHSDLKNRKGEYLPPVKGYVVEDLMLSDCMVWLNNTHTPNQIKLKNGKIVNDLISIYHIENEGTFGGQYGAMQGAISKGKGKKKGILDIHCCYLGLNCYIEAKLENGVFSDEQLHFITLLISWKIDVFVFRNFDFFKYIIEEVILKRRYLGGGVFNTVEQIKTRIQ